MKSDKDLFRVLQEKNRSVRLFTEAQILDLMARARKEETDDYKKRVPTMKNLQDEFNIMLDKSKNDTSLAAGYNLLSDEKRAWAWFTQGAAAVLKRFKDAN